MTHPILTAIEAQFNPTSFGLCICGCGQATKLADRRDHLRMGYEEGQPLQYVREHIGRLSDEGIERRFWAQVLVSPTGCWEWIGELSYKGYGRFKVKGQRVNAHNYAYEKCVGPMPSGLQADHLCRNRKCVNYLHLEPVTRRENLIRGMSPVGINYRKTHCMRGHLLGVPVQGKRRKCQKCFNARQRERRWAAGVKPTRGHYA